jgi:hypothetical protein
LNSLHHAAVALGHLEDLNLRVYGFLWHLKMVGE